MGKSVAGVILAAGRSTRFGPDDKLLAELEGRPLIAHVAGALQEVELAGRAVVSVADRPEVLTGFTRLDVAPGQGQAASLVAAVAHARRLGASHLLVVLGDMPRLTSTDLQAVIERSGDLAACATDGRKRLPPACFPASDFDRLAQMTGDQGARPILSELPETQLVGIPPRRLCDVDTVDDLQALRD